MHHTKPFAYALKTILSSKVAQITVSILIRNVIKEYTKLFVDTYLFVR